MLKVLYINKDTKIRSDKNDDFKYSKYDPKNTDCFFIRIISIESSITMLINIYLK